MRSIESDGDTIDKAIANALRALNVAREQVQIEILTDATRGLLGFGGKKARVRATVRPPVVSRLDHSEGEVSEMDSRETLVGPECMSRMDSRETLAGPEHGQPRPRQVRDVGSQAPLEGEHHAGAASEAFELKCKATLEAILSRLGVSCRMQVGPGPAPGSVLLAVTADSSGLLIGRRGQTLDALEYIVNRIVAREDEASRRVMIDVERYRERRLEHLTQLARRLAEKAKHTGRIVTLNPMSPRDRRAVHLALQSDTAVSTRSQGDGQYRKVIIVPTERARTGRRPKTPAG
jgi:spoIIIJ-associated protein